MPKYKIHWDAGFGKSEEIIESETLEEAQKEAYDRWLEEAQDEADYGAEPTNEKEES